MNAWFAGQSPREQLILLCTAVVAVVAGLYLFVVEPLSNGSAERQLQVASLQKDLQWMQQQSILVSGTGGSAGIKAMESPPYLLLDREIRRAGITAPDRVTPDGNQGAKAQFPEVQFDKLLQVLGSLEDTYGLAIKTANLSKKNEGVVSARLSLEAP